MTAIERDLQALSRFMPKFLGVLAVAIASLPLVDKVFQALPIIIRHDKLTSLAATLVAVALIGRHWTRRRSQKKFPTGRRFLLVGVLLVVAYVGVGGAILSSNIETSPFVEAILIIWYIAIYCSLTMGMWQMAWRAYVTRDKVIEWHLIEPVIS